MNFLWLCTVIICLAIGYSFGFHTRDAQDKINEHIRKQKAKKQADIQEPQSTILEPPLTPEQKILREHEEMLERLNG